MEIKTVLFDLDGTLTDSGPGIMNSVQYALTKYGRPAKDLSELCCFVGPPLFTQFPEYLGCELSKEECTQMVDWYREYYEEKGIFENRLYDGIPALLERLKGAGRSLMLATSKPEKFANIVMEHFDIAKYFDLIGGALMNESRTEKVDVIEYVLETAGISSKETVLMVGDRKYDILGAKQVGVHSMGVLYGYGTREELEQAGADWIAATPEEVGEKLLCIE